MCSQVNFRILSFNLQVEEMTPVPVIPCAICELFMWKQQIASCNSTMVLSRPVFDKSCDHCVKIARSSERYLCTKLLCARVHQASDCPWLALLPHNGSLEMCCFSPFLKLLQKLLCTAFARNAPEFVLSDFPGCKRLEEAYRKIYHIPNKTPLSVLYEYASRLNLTVRVRLQQTLIVPLFWLSLLTSHAERSCGSLSHCIPVVCSKSRAPGREM